MKKLLKTYGFNSDMQYYEMIADSFINGQIKQGQEQFVAMSKANRITLCKSLALGNWDISISKELIEKLFDLI